MKFPNYGGGAQGDLLIANELDAEELRPYAEVQHYDQIVQKKDMHLYVERVPEEEAGAEVSVAVGGVLRKVGHIGTDGYATFKGNLEDEYAPTTDLYATVGQTDPQTTWPDFWRRGLSGPAAMWAQFARGFAKAYTAWQARQNSAWGSLPDIGDAVIIVPRPNLAPFVYCIKGYLGAEPLVYLRVQVAPESQFDGATVPDEILDLFGGVPIPPLADDWPTASPLATLAPAAVFAAAGVPAADWAWRNGFQHLCVGPYAVPADGQRADTVVAMQHDTTLVPKTAHLRISFAATDSGALQASVSLVAEGCPTGPSITVRGVEWFGGFIDGFAGVPGGTGPGWSVDGDSPACPLIVTYMDGVLTSVDMVRRRSTPPSGFPDVDVFLRVSGAIDLEVVFEKARRKVIGASRMYSSEKRTFSVSGSPGAWVSVQTGSALMDYRFAEVVSQAPAGVLGRLNFIGDEAIFYVVSAEETGGGTGTPGFFKATLNYTWVTEHASTLPPEGQNESFLFHAVANGGGPTTVLQQTPFGYVGPVPGTVGPGTGAPDWIVLADTIATFTQNTPNSNFRSVDLYVDAERFSLDLNAIYPHFGALPPTIAYPNINLEMQRLAQELPRADPDQPVFVDVARSVVGGTQIVGRVAGLSDPEYSMPALLGTLVETVEDAQFPNAHRVYFVGELQP